MSGNGQASVWLCAFQGVLATLTCGLCCWLCVSYSGTKPVKNQENQDEPNDQVEGPFKGRGRRRNSSCVSHPMENQKETIRKYRSEELMSYSKDKHNDTVEIKTEESEHEEEEDINEFEKEVLEHLKIEHCKDIGTNVKVEEKNEIRKEQEEPLSHSKEDTDWTQLNNTDNTYIHYLCNKIESESKQKEKDSTFMKSSTSEVHSDFKTLETNFNSCGGIHKGKYRSGTNVNSESSFFLNSGSELNGLNKMYSGMNYQNNYPNNDKRFCLNIPEHSNIRHHDSVNPQECNLNAMNYMLQQKKQKNKPLYQEGEKQDKTIHNLESRDRYDYLQHCDIKRSNEYHHGQTNRYIDIIPKEINNYIHKQDITCTKDSDNSLPTCSDPMSFQMKEIEFHENHKKRLLMDTSEDRNEIKRNKKKIKTEGDYNEINNSLQGPKYIHEECTEHKIVDNICISKYTNDAPYNRFLKNTRNHHVSTHDLLLPNVSSNENINGYRKPLGINKKNIAIESMDQSFNGSPVIPLSTYILEKSIDRKLSFPFEQSRQPEKSEKSKCIKTFEEMEPQRKMNEGKPNEVNQRNINQAIYEYLRNSMNECNEESETQEEAQEEKKKKQTKIEYISKEWMYKPTNILSDIEVQNSKGGAWSYAQVKLNIDPCETESVLRINKENKRMEKSMNDENKSMDSYNETNEESYQNETLEFEEMLQNIKSEYVEEENIDTDKNRKNKKIELKKVQRKMGTEKEHKLSSYRKNEEQTNLQIMENLRRSQRIKTEKDKQNQQITRRSKIQIYVKKEKNIIQKKKFQGEYEKEITRNTISQNKRIQKIKYMNGSPRQLSDRYTESESLNDGRDLLIKICNQHRQVDEYRCASGFANFLIQHMNNKKDENFSDLLSFILKLKEEYKMTTPDFIEVFLILETINVDVLKKYSNKGWLFVTIHFLKKKSMDRNLKSFIKLLRMDTATISNLTASFYMNKKEIHIEEKEVLRVLSILSDVVIRRSSRIKHSSGTHEVPKGQSKEKQNKEEVLGSCWEPIVIEESLSK